MEYLAIAAIGFIAFFLKGMTGTGTTTAIVGLSILIIDPKAAIVLASFVNIWGGLYMLRQDTTKLALKYWFPIAAAMMLGSILGAYALKMIDSSIFNIVLGITFVLIALFFLKPTQRMQPTITPITASPLDNIIGAIAGFCGGFIGINAPVLVGYFGQALNKQYLRRLLVIIFIPAAIAQTATFAVNGLLTKQIIFYGLAILPAMIAGITCGNHLFQKISEITFKRILAVFLFAMALKLLL